MPDEAGTLNLLPGLNEAAAAASRGACAWRPPSGRPYCGRPVGDIFVALLPSYPRFSPVAGMATSAGASASSSAAAAAAVASTTASFRRSRLRRRGEKNMLGRAALRVWCGGWRLLAALWAAGCARRLRAIATPACVACWPCRRRASACGCAWRCGWTGCGSRPDRPRSTHCRASERLLFMYVMCGHKIHLIFYPRRLSLLPSRPQPRVRLWPHDTPHTITTINAHQRHLSRRYGPLPTHSRWQQSCGCSGQARSPRCTRLAAGRCDSPFSCCENGGSRQASKASPPRQLTHNCLTIEVEESSGEDHASRCLQRAAQDHDENIKTTYDGSN